MQITSFLRMCYLKISVVHCRAGSLENNAQRTQRLLDVHCRAGSLEINRPRKFQVGDVHCRAGSLERCKTGNQGDCVRSLPCRQLRKSTHRHRPEIFGSLPCRQLRNRKASSESHDRFVHCRAGSLEN